uniref:SDR family oxidoreductase n=1 Tax=Gracilinema caldarium TaxID=215591 RepID=A0A7C3IJF6_9SPIR
MNWLLNKVIVITGGGGVLCSTIAKGLAQRGAKIALLNRTFEKAEKVVCEILANGGEALAVACDVLSKDACIQAKEKVNSAFGTCDILINGAGGNDPQGSTARETWESDDMEANGIPRKGSFLSLEPAGIEYVLHLNFMGTVIPTQVFIPDMLNREGSSIINISSMGAFAPMTKGVAYCAAKAAINNITQWLAIHYAPAQIRVNAIAPGFFSTEQNKHLLWNPDGSPTKRTEQIIAHTPMKRLGKPEDLVGIAAWLCDYRASGFVTGAVIPVDGGFMAYSGV